MPKSRNGGEGDSNLGLFDQESGILPLSYSVRLISLCGVLWSAVAQR